MTMTKEADKDLAEVLAQLTNLIMNERVRSFNEGVDAERERCASIAEHLNGWGASGTHGRELAEHIAKVIRDHQ
jgi:hypothetical protein